MAGSHVPTKVVESKQMKHLVRELYSPENISFPTNASEEKQTIESVIFGPLRWYVLVVEIYKHAKIEVEWTGPIESNSPAIIIQEDMHRLQGYAKDSCSDVINHHQQAPSFVWGLGFGVPARSIRRSANSCIASSCSRVCNTKIHHKYCFNSTKHAPHPRGSFLEIHRNAFDSS